LLLDHGAQAVYACATHAVFSGRAPEILADSMFTEVVVTNTIPIPPAKHFPQLKILSVANVIGEAIWRVHEDSSVSSMFR
jgi:ribose-phosphate pyrophosphokinase